MHPPESFSLKDLLLKLITLFALLSGQRHQTLLVLDVVNMSFTGDAVKFRIAEILKQTRPGYQVPELVFPAYEVEKCLCPVAYSIQYLKVTKNIRMKEKRFFVSYRKPHSAVTTQTIARWIKTILVRSGIDLSIFKPCSTRSAAASKASLKLQTGTILKTIGWSNEKTFARFYRKKIVSEGTLARAILDSSA